MTSGGGAKKFSRLAIAHHIYDPLINYYIIRPLPRPPSQLERVSPLHSTPLLMLSVFQGAFGALSLVPLYFSDQSYAPDCYLVYTSIKAYLTSLFGKHFPLKILLPEKLLDLSFMVYQPLMAEKTWNLGKPNLYI